MCVCVCVYVCAYVCMCMRICVCVYVLIPLWRPDISVRVLSALSLVEAEENAAHAGKDQHEGHVVQHKFDPIRGDGCLCRSL